MFIMSWSPMSKNIRSIPLMSMRTCLTSCFWPLDHTFQPVLWNDYSWALTDALEEPLNPPASLRSKQATRPQGSNVSTPRKNQGLPMKLITLPCETEIWNEMPNMWKFWANISCEQWALRFCVGEDSQLLPPRNEAFAKGDYERVSLKSVQWGMRYFANR